MSVAGQGAPSCDTVRSTFACSFTMHMQSVSIIQHHWRHEQRRLIFERPQHSHACNSQGLDMLKPEEKPGNFVQYTSDILQALCGLVILCGHTQKWVHSDLTSSAASVEAPPMSCMMLVRYLPIPARCWMSTYWHNYLVLAVHLAGNTKQSYAYHCTCVLFQTLQHMAICPGQRCCTCVHLRSSVHTLRTDEKQLNSSLQYFCTPLQNLLCLQFW